MIIHLTADRGDSRLRLDQVLVRRVSDVSRMSRTRAQGWIAAGLVRVNGIPASRASARIREGASIAVSVDAATPLREVPAPEALPLDILYEDADIVAVNKPAGIVVHPSFRNAHGTVLNALLWHLRDRPDVRPGLLNRLDKDTSGILLVALSRGTHARLQRDAQGGGVTKTYLAIVRGTPRPRTGVLTDPLLRDPSDRRRVIAAPNGAPSETRYQVLSHGPTYSMVECRLVTGRTHQIRVHLATHGWPIAGDQVYGAPDPAIGRQALHAWRVTLPHPVSRAFMQIEAPLPSDMQALSARVRPGRRSQS